MPGIFISYRRDDAPGYAGRLYDFLAERYGQDRVKMGAGEAESCDLMLVLIGRNWIYPSDRESQERLHDPYDFVRKDIAQALASGKKAIPVLVADARIPDASHLPQDVAALARLNAFALSDVAWHDDVQRLAQVLGPVAVSSAITRPLLIAAIPFATP